MKFDQYAENYDAGWRGTKSARFYPSCLNSFTICLGKQNQKISSIIADNHFT
jgi:hypothetical protein